MKRLLTLFFIALILLATNRGEDVIWAKESTVYYSFATEKKELALTFDDGPMKKNTPKILNILKEYNIKATFFLLGENMQGNEKIIQRIYQEGHQIGLHTYSHPNFNKLNKAQIQEEIYKNIELLQAIIDYTPTFIRPPYGIVTEDFLEIASEMKLTIISWSNDSLDWKKECNSDQIVNNALSKIHPGSIILMHDKSSNYLASRKALPRIIKRCLSLDYTFKTVKEFF